VEKPQRRLRHLQHRRSVKHGGPVRRLLGVKLQLQIQKPPQPLILAASAEHQQVGDRHACEQAGGERGRSEGCQELTQVPEAAGCHHRIPAGEGPIAAVKRVADSPEAFAPGEVLLTLQPPALRVMPEMDRRTAVGEIDHAPGIEDVSLRQRQVQMSEQTGMTPPGFQPGHLGGADIEGPWSTPERSGTASGLVMGFQQGHRHALMGQQARRRQAGDASTDDDHSVWGQGAEAIRSMLASIGFGRG